MDKEGLEAIYRCIAKTSIKELKIISGKGTEVTIVRSNDEIKKSNQSLLVKAAKEQSSVGVGAVQANEQSNRFDITAPEVGFFNRYNVKTKQQFFKLRDVVQKGEVIATVSALNSHYEIKATETGKIIEFLVEQEQPVEFGQPLIRLEKVEE